MFSRFARKKQQQSPRKNTSSQEGEQDGGPDQQQTGFICPMCMEALPGPAELQVHFEQKHGEGVPTEKLVEIEDDATDALPESSSEDLLTPTLPGDYSKAKLELALDPNAPDTEKEVVLLQQELAEMVAQLKEEKWYSSQLKVELDKVSKERDKLEEEKALDEENYNSQLRSAEEGYLTVVEENSKLKEELKFADYNTTKERHEKLKLEMIGYKNEADEERLRRQALEDSLKLLQSELDQSKVQATKIEEQLQARPSSDEVTQLRNQIDDLTTENSSLKSQHATEIVSLEDQWNKEKDDLIEKVRGLDAKVKEVTSDGISKGEQITSLQAALTLASAASESSKQQTSEKSQQIIHLQRRTNELETEVKYKSEELVDTNKQLNELKVALVAEKSAKEQQQNEVYNLNSKMDEFKHQYELQATTIKSLEGNLLKEKDEVNRLEKERIELIAKIEAGEGTDTVIQQLSQEKAKLLEAITSFEKSILETNEKHQAEIEIMRQEKIALKDEVQKLNQKIQTNESRVQEMSTKIKERESDLFELKEELKTKTSESFNKEAEFLQKESKLKERITGLEKTCSQLEGEKQSQETFLGKLKEDLQKNETQREQQQSWLETKNNAINEMTVRVTSLQEQLNTKNLELKTSSNTLEKMIKESQASRESFQKAKLEFEKEKNDLLDEKKTTEDNLKTAQTKNDLLQENIEELRKEKKQMEDVENGLTKKIGELNEAMESIKISGKEEVQRLNEEQQQKLKEFDETLLTLKSEHEKDLSVKENKLFQTKEELSNAKVNMEAEIKSRCKADEKVLEWESKYNRLEQVLEQKDAVLQDAQAKLEVAENELKKPCDSCKNYEIQLCRLQETTKDQSGQIEQLNSQLESMEEKLQNVQSEKNDMEKNHAGICEQLKDNIKKLEETTSDLEKIRKGNKEEITKLTAELEVSRSENGKLAEERNELIGVKENLEKEFAMVSNKNQQLEEDIIDLKASKEVVSEELKKVKLEYEQQRETFAEEKINLDEQLKEIQEKLMEEVQSHIDSKDNASKLQMVLQEQCADLQNKFNREKKKCEELLQSKEHMESSFKKEIETIQCNIKKLEKDVSNRDRIITEHEMKLKSMESESNDLKGDISVLEAQIQNGKEEKRALLERVLATEEDQKKTKQKLSETKRQLDQSLAGLQELGQENQNLQVQQTIKSNRQWEKDSEVSNCKKCDKQFTMTVRKHHCRSCGSIFCKDCSAFSAVIASSKKPVRVCEACSVELSSVRGSSVRRLSNSSLISSTSGR